MSGVRQGRSLAAAEPARLVTLAEADALRAVADDDRVTVEWPFSRLVLDEPPVLFVPVSTVKHPKR